MPHELGELHSIFLRISVESIRFLARFQCVKPAYSIQFFHAPSPSSSIPTQDSTVLTRSLLCAGTYIHLSASIRSVYAVLWGPTTFHAPGVYRVEGQHALAYDLWINL